MNTKVLIYRVFSIGFIVSLILLPLVKFNQASATTDISQPKELPVLDKNRLKRYKPGGSFGSLEGGILLRGEDTTSQDKEGFTVKFTNIIDFQAEVWDPIVGKKDGNGIESVQFQIFDEDDIDKLVHERLEMNEAYCPFGGGELRCDIGQLAKNHKYRVEIRPISKKPSLKKTVWFFHLQT